MAHRRRPLSGALAMAVRLAIAVRVVNARLAAPPPAPFTADVDTQGSVERGSVPPAAPAPPHFATQTYSALWSSGDRVGHAVQRVLGVQGNLQEVKEDLYVEYARWNKKKQELVSERSRVEHEIASSKAMLRQQLSLHADASRLRGDLALAQRVMVDQEQKQTETREDWLKRQEVLRQEMGNLTSNIALTEQTRLSALAVHQSSIGEMRKNQSALNEEGAQANRTIAELVEARSNQTVTVWREQAGLLQELAVLQQHKVNVTTALHEQQRLEWVLNKLAAQAREVAEAREKARQEFEDCDAKIAKWNAELLATAQAMQADKAKLQECQTLQAENDGLVQKATACRAASASWRAVN